MQVLICSGDRDAFQLINDDVTVLYPKRGVSELARMDPAAVAARYGVGPEHYRAIAAMVGETSDNLAGVPGVGEKTAAKWIVTYGDFDGVVEHVDQIKGKVGDSLREHLGSCTTWYCRSTRPRRLGVGGTARQSTGSSTPFSSGCCETGSTSTWRRLSPRPSLALTWPARYSVRVRSGPGSIGTHRSG
jgi:hypothetical protein